MQPNARTSAGIPLMTDEQARGYIRDMTTSEATTTKEWPGTSAANNAVVSDRPPSLSPSELASLVGRLDMIQRNGYAVNRGRERHMASEGGYSALPNALGIDSRHRAGSATVSDPGSTVDHHEWTGNEPASDGLSPRSSIGSFSSVGGRPAWSTSSSPGPVMAASSTTSVGVARSYFPSILKSPPRRQPNLNPSIDDPLYWILLAGSTTGRNPDVHDLLTSHGYPRYRILRVPHTLYDEKTWTGLRVRAKVTRIFHGTWYGKKAVWIGLHVAHTKGKVQQTEVTVDIACGGEIKDEDLPKYFEDAGPFQPYFVRSAPKKQYGSANSVERSDEAGLEGDVSAPTPGGKVGVKGTIKRTTNVALEKRQIITTTISEPSSAFSDSAISSETVLTLRARQNEVTQDGIYDELPMGMVIVTHGRPVVLTVNVEPKQKSKIRAYVPGSYKRSAPILIDGQDWVGDGFPANASGELETWAKAGLWDQLVNYPQDFTSVLVEE